MSVGVMEDYKLRYLRASHTLGWLKETTKKKRQKFICSRIKKKARAEGNSCHA
jgi:hypothetical protein